MTDFGQPRRLSDHAGRIRYSHNSKHWYWGGRYEDIGTGFRADSGFIPQVGYRLVNVGTEFHGYGEKGRNWYSHWSLGGNYDRSHEQNGELLAEETKVWISAQGPMQSFGQINVGDRHRRFNSVTFHEQFLSWNAEVRPVGDFYIYLNGTLGDQIDFANTELGKQKVASGGVRWNIGNQARVDLDQSYEDLNVDGGQLFAARVTQLRTIYQFNIRMLARAILQYTDVTRDPALYRFATVDSHSKRLFPQLLFSYKVNPQTVFFAGYSGTRLGGNLDGVNVGLTEADRTFFVKMGYAWLF